MSFFVLEERNSLVVIEYNFKFFELNELYRTTTRVVTKAFNEIFSTFRIPAVIPSDNGPQFNSGEFSGFGEERGSSM